MKGLAYLNRKKRLLVIGVVLSLVYFVNFNWSHWVRKTAEDKVSEFLGHRLRVNIDDISGGVFKDMILSGVGFISGEGEKKKVFRLDRMEISYRLWDVVKEKLGISSFDDTGLRYIKIYFSNENPFIRGVLNFYKSPGKIEVLGYVSPEVLGDDRKRGIKGTFTKNNEGEYDCSVLWGKETEITGKLMPEEKTIKLEMKPGNSEKGIISVTGTINEKNSVEVYSRIGKLKVFGREVIGDIWVAYKDTGNPSISFKFDNLLIDKKPFWPLKAEGTLFREENKFILDNASWGQNLKLSGDVELKGDYPADIKLEIADLELEDIKEMLSDDNTPFKGKMESKMFFSGPIKNADVKGHIYIGEGVMDNMEFTSIFATLKGKLPVIRVIDSRVVKPGGHLIISGEMDFSKMKEGKAFDGVIFDTDNRVAVWEDWQISKEGGTNLVEATRDNMTFTTNVDEGNHLSDSLKEEYLEREVSMKYKIDTNNSIRFDFEEDNDFMGVEHKIQF